MANVTISAIVAMVLRSRCIGARDLRRLELRLELPATRQSRVVIFLQEVFPRQPAFKSAEEV